jgi:hypothetical protein
MPLAASYAKGMRLPVARFLAFAGLLAAGAAAVPPATASPVPPPVRFNTAFPGAALGRIEQLGTTEYRLHVPGQQDARGRNRQATWYAFRIDDPAGRALTLRLTSFKGEYNNRPARSPAGAWLRPVFSDDGETWRHVDTAEWDETADELTFILPPGGPTRWVAHVPPYPRERLAQLLDELGSLPHVRIEIVGHSVQGRPLHLLTITDPARPDTEKNVLWLQARQHAWEAGTSFVMEGALRFAAGDDPAAHALRSGNVLLFVPMIDADGVERGTVRFNANGYDLNRHWSEVDLRDKRWLERVPETWYVKRAMLERHARQPIALALNLHNTETNEYLDTHVDGGPELARLQALFARARQDSIFDPTRPSLTISGASAAAGGTTNAVWREAGIPMVLLEQRIGPSPRLGRIATSEDRLAFGRDLIQLMSAAARKR